MVGNWICHHEDGFDPNNNPYWREWLTFVFKYVESPSKLLHSSKGKKIYMQDKIKHADN